MSPSRHGVSPSHHVQSEPALRRSPLALVAIGLIRLYQLVLSPLFPSSCRFTPSCSNYTLEAIRVHGFMRGAWLGLRRISKCHPLHAGGVDNVPPATKHHCHGS